MTIPGWQLQTPIDAIVFDCDGTLSAIEGVNELARSNGVYEIVEALTTEAMSITGINPELYQKRLNLIHPKEQQLYALAEEYYRHSVPDIFAIILLLQRLNKSVYLASAGLNPAVAIFGKKLSIPHEHIYAVDTHFDQAGNYLDYDRSSPLIHNYGKRDIVCQLKNKHPHIVHIGDGLNDFSTHDIVTRFIGYGGVYYREQMEKVCQYYITTPSLAPLLPLCLTPDELEELTEQEQALYKKGVQAILDQQVKVR